MANFYELPLGNDFPYFVVNSSGASVPASGYQIGTFQAGTTTPVTTYTDSTGGTPNANPILIGSTGLPQSGANVVGIWAPQGQLTKVTFALPTDTFPPSSAIWTRDQLPGNNDPTNITTSGSEWITGTTPTFVSSTSFSIVGDQRTIYQVGRRVKTVNSGGTAYSRITASTFATGINTVTVVNDSTALDAGISSLAYGILSPTNESIPLNQNTPSLPGVFSSLTSTGFTFTRATADQSVISSTALASATNFSQAVAANEEWILDCYWDVGASLSTTGLSVGVNAPSGATANLAVSLVVDAGIPADTNAASGRTTSLNTAVSFIPGNLAASLNGFVHASAWILNGATPGTIQFQFAQQNNIATNVTIHKGSHMIAFRIGG